MSKKLGGMVVERILAWLQTSEQRMLLWANRRSLSDRVNTWLGRWLGTITHTGGATFTLSTSLLIALFADDPWNTAGWQSLTAVALSHIPVFIVKRKFKRLRPYQALKQVNIGKKPLVDPSFPSGHTTAIFAWMIPLLMADAALLPFLAPLALVIGLSVAWSRMYLGLHYPSDIAAGGLLGFLTALGTSYIGWLP
jgi:undecaprenyl-diphosphatase